MVICEADVELYNFELESLRKTLINHSDKVTFASISELKCDISHFHATNKGSSNAKYSLDEILVENSTYANLSRLKERLVKEGRMEYKCEKCGISEWLGQPLSLHLDHRNGINNDHRQENLRFLCPNCHSQTDTYAGKNKNKGK